MPAFRAPRGTRDLLPDERLAFERLDAELRDEAQSKIRLGESPHPAIIAIHREGQPLVAKLGQLADSALVADRKSTRLNSSHRT